MRMPAGLGIVAVVFSLMSASGATAGAQQPSSERQRKRIAEYVSLVKAFRAGDDGPVNALLLWPHKNVLEVLEALESKHPAFAGWTPPLTKAAAMLHTAAAVRLLGREGEGENALFFLFTASDLLKNHSGDLRRFASAWHVAASRLMLDRTRIEGLDSFLDAARRHVPDDPEILYTSGFVAEFMAGPPSFEPLPAMSSGGRSMRLDAAFDRIWRRREDNLRDAQRWLEAALGFDPGHRMARLHLGRVEMLREHDTEALAGFEAVRAAAEGDAQLLYLAWLFEGAVHERAARMDRAIASYRQAIAALPACHAGYVALGEALQRSGHGDQSRQVLQQLLRTGRPRTLEPWWMYFFEDSRVTEARLNSLLKEARQ